SPEFTARHFPFLGDPLECHHRQGSSCGCFREKDALSMPKVTFVKEKIELDVPAGANLREEARKAGLTIYPGHARYLNCLGHGMCGTCKVLVKKGMENVSPKGVIEKMNMTL